MPEHVFSNQDIAESFLEMAASLEANGRDFFRIRAYRNAASSIEKLNTPLRELWENKQLEDIAGIGATIREKLDELFTTGEIQAFLKEKAGLPPGMFALMKVSGIGPKTAFKLASIFKLQNASTALKDVKALAEQGKISGLEGFGAKSEQEILTAVTEYKETEQRMLLPEGEFLAERILTYLKTSPDVLEAQPLGSLRRKASTVGDIDIAVATHEPQKVMDHLKKFNEIHAIISSGPATTMFKHATGRQVDVKTHDPAKWGSILQHYTGSKLHNIHLRTLAQKKAQSLSEHGIKENGELHTYATEEAFYNALGMDWIPPELREDTGEIEAAIARTLPKLIELQDIKGDLHMHCSIDIKTSHDLGANSVSEMLDQAKTLGYEYIGISDHNPKQSGLTPKERIEIIKKRNEIIDAEAQAWREKNNSHLIVLKGLEVDIKPDGTLSLEDEALELLDYAIVSLHSEFSQDSKTVTDRVINAFQHPKVKIFGHPTGRRLLKREGAALDWERIFAACKEFAILLEVNSAAERLDLPDVIIREAVKNKMPLIIDTDSHSADHLPAMKYGVWTARRGWATSKDVMNTLAVEEFKKILKK